MSPHWIQFWMFVLAASALTCLTTVTGFRAKESWDQARKADRLVKEGDPAVAEIDKKDNELLVTISARKHLIRLALDIPVLGNVTNVHDYNSLSDARTISKQIVGPQLPNAQNNVELLVENVRAGVKLSYKIIFEPIERKLVVAGTDRYKVSYTWSFEGETLSRERWISFETGNEVEKPKMQVKGATVYDKVLSPEEIKELYRKGPPKREAQ